MKIRNNPNNNGVPKEHNSMNSLPFNNYNKGKSFKGLDKNSEKEKSKLFAEKYLRER